MHPSGYSNVSDGKSTVKNAARRWKAAQDCYSVCPCRLLCPKTTLVEMDRNGTMADTIDVHAAWTQNYNSMFLCSCLWEQNFDSDSCWLAVILFVSAMLAC
ncbi:unnamed protein product [Durusdinium trenchii]|uniref:Uncharacterized protein n=2 Tax=Durusdinium trenchii TaxID=1381693 RepID=A0ABP0PTG6_9DINO